MLKITDTYLGAIQGKSGGGLESSNRLVVDDRFVSYANNATTVTKQATLMFDGTDPMQQTPALIYQIFADTNNTQVDLNVTAKGDAEGVLLLGFEAQNIDVVFGAFLDTKKGIFGIGAAGDGEVKYLSHTAMPENTTKAKLSLRVYGGQYMAVLKNVTTGQTTVVTSAFEQALNPRPVITGTHVLSGYVLNGLTVSGLTSKEDNPKSVEYLGAVPDLSIPEETYPIAAKVQILPELSKDGVRLSADNLQAVVLSDVLNPLDGTFLLDAQAELVIRKEAGSVASSDVPSPREVLRTLFTFNAGTRTYVAIIPESSVIGGTIYTVTVTVKHKASTAVFTQDVVAKAERPIT